LHKVAEELGIKRHWFHKDHYDIPKKMMVSTMPSFFIKVSPRQIHNIIHHGHLCDTASEQVGVNERGQQILLPRATVQEACALPGVLLAEDSFTPVGPGSSASPAAALPLP